MNLIEYKKKFYQFLKNNNFIVLKEKSIFSTQLVAYKKDNQDIFRSGSLISNKFENFYQDINFNEFIKNNATKTISTPGNEDIVFDFFIKTFNEGSKEEKNFLIKELDSATNKLWVKNIFHVLDNISENNKEIISNIHLVPISVWETTTIDLNNLDIYIESKKISDVDLNKFYLKFFKSRKNQLKNSRIGPQVRDFLLRKYNKSETLLSPYFDFFNYIKDEFCEIDLTFEELNNKNTVATRINCRKASQLLCIDGFNETKIKDEISKFVYAMKSFKKIEQIIIEDYDKSKAVIEIRCYTDTTLTKEELNNEIKNFLLFKKKNIQIETNKQNVESFLMKKELDSQLKENNNKIAKKIKI